LANGPNTSPRALGAILLILGGGLVAAFGLLFSLFGVYSIAEGYAFAHAGGLQLLVFGLALTAGGVWAAKNGLRIYRKIENNVG
jgi:hypothetical protein